MAVPARFTKLDTTNANDELWVLQVPAMLGDLIAAAPPGADLGRLERIQLAYGKSDVLVRLSDSHVPEADRHVTPTDYHVKDGLAVPGRVIRLAGGSAALAGITSIFSEAKPSSSDPAFIARKKRDREADAAEQGQARKGTRMAVSSESASTSGRFVGIRMAEAAEQARKEGKSASSLVTAWEPSVEEAVAKASALPGGTTLFGLFRFRAYYARDQLRSAIQGTEAAPDAASAEQEIRAKCDYLQSGPRRGKWVLKERYRGPDSAKQDPDRPMRELFRPGQGFTRRDLVGSIRTITGIQQLAEDAVDGMLEAGAVVERSAAAAAAAAGDSSSSSAAGAAQAGGSSTGGARLYLADESRRPRSVAELLRRRQADGLPLMTAGQVCAALLADLTPLEAEAQLRAVCRGEISSAADVCELDEAKLRAMDEARRA
ncbi:hypothetical protein FNF31_05184 [Cafeteria roenbergensis]|uniref:Transcription initiation factor IIF subunit beta n=1 Tax=Cafeteria roenbergensis TaxID=33653 RepID=A0A5A8D4N9_CAFRO|nr:hypothetical protein FNF31_05184 [Cafeteria roenbergensis]